MSAGPRVFSSLIERPLLAPVAGAPVSCFAALPQACTRCAQSARAVAGTESSSAHAMATRLVAMALILRRLPQRVGHFRQVFPRVLLVRNLVGLDAGPEIQRQARFERCRVRARVALTSRHAHHGYGRGVRVRAEI